LIELDIEPILCDFTSNEEKMMFPDLGSMIAKLQWLELAAPEIRDAALRLG